MDGTWNLDYFDFVPCELSESETSEEFVPACFSPFQGLTELTIFGGRFGLECIHEAECCEASMEFYHFAVNDMYGSAIPRICVHMPVSSLYLTPVRVSLSPQTYQCKECRQSEEEERPRFVPCPIHRSCYVYVDVIFPSGQQPRLPENRFEGDARLGWLNYRHHGAPTTRYQG